MLFEGDDEALVLDDDEALELALLADEPREGDVLSSVDEDDEALEADEALDDDEALDADELADDALSVDELLDELAAELDDEDALLEDALEEDDEALALDDDALDDDALAEALVVSSAPWPPLPRSSPGGSSAPFFLRVMSARIDGVMMVQPQWEKSPFILCTIHAWGISPISSLGDRVRRGTR